MTPSPRFSRCTLLAATLACLGGLVSACGGGSPTVTATRTVTVSAAATAAGTATASPPAAAPVTPAAGPQPCPTRSLKLTFGLAQGAAGSVFQVIDFTNISAVTCTLYGYPGVSLVGGSPVRQIGLAAKEDPVTPRVLVTLAPGAVANANLRVVQAGDFPAAKCGPVTSKYLKIYPPNQTTPVYLHYVVQACSKPIQQLTIQVVTAGSGG